MAKTVFGMPGVGNKPKEEGKPNTGAPTGNQGGGSRQMRQPANRPAAKPAMAKPAMAKPAMARPVNTPMARPSTPAPGAGSGAGAPGGGVKTVFGMPAMKLPGGNGPAQPPTQQPAPPAQQPTPSQQAMSYQATQVLQAQQPTGARGASSPAPPDENKFGIDETVTGMTSQPPDAFDIDQGGPTDQPDSPLSGLDDILSDAPDAMGDMADARPQADAMPSEAPVSSPSMSAPPKKGGNIALKIIAVIVLLGVVGAIVTVFVMSSGDPIPVRPPALPEQYGGSPAGVGVPGAPGVPSVVPPPPPPPPGAAGVVGAVPAPGAVVPPPPPPPPAN